MTEVEPKAGIAGAVTRRVKFIRPNSFSVLGVFNQLRELTRYFDLIHTLSQHRIRVRYKQSALGLAWAIMQPLSLMLIYTLVFSIIVRMPSSGAPYAVFAYTAL